MTRLFRINRLLCLVAPSAAVIWMGAQSYHDVTRLITISKEVEHGRERIDRLTEVGSLLKEAESSQRGALLTGSNDYLATYETTHNRLNALVGELATGSPGQGPGRLLLAIDEKLAELDRTIALNKAGNHDAALALVRTDRGEVLKREILASLTRMERAERDGLVILKREAEGSAVGLVWWLVARLALTLMMTLGLYAVSVVEIRNRRRVESDLRESEERFRRGFDTAAIGMALVGLDGRILRVNQSLCGCLGYSEEELLARDFQSITHPDDLEVDVAQLARVAAGEIDTYRLEKRYLHKSGHEVFTLLGVSVVRDQAGRAIHVFSQVQDLTARMIAERQVREDHRFMTSVADSLPVTLYLFDLTRQTTIWANARHALTFDIRAEELAAVGNEVEALVHPEDMPAIDAHQARLRSAADGEICEVEFRARHRSGEWRWFRSHDVVFRRDAEGRPIEILGSGEDITDRRRASAELAMARTQLADAIESLDSGLVMYDHDDRLVVCNRRVREIYPAVAEFMTTGATFEEILRGSMINDVESEERPRIDEAIAQQIEGHRRFRGVFEHKVGERWVRVAASPTVDGGVVRLHTDITEMKRNEDDLRSARDSARAAERVKSEFLANMSHEIRTPMNGVLGMAELVLGTALSPRQREYVSTIQSSAEGLLTVINDILDFSKVEAGKLHLDRAPFGLRACLDDTLRAFAARAVTKGLELCVRVDPRTPDILLGDSHRLRQVVINLVGNAIKFTERGEVVVSVESEPGGNASDASVTLAFSVADTGIGVPEARRAAIFEPFEQADGSTTRKFGGTGLGLAISSKLASLMGGSIAVEGRPGGGSVFRFTATFGRPLANEIRAFGAAVEGPPALAGSSVLIVDDNATSRAILAEMLEDWRMKPTAVADADSAIALIRDMGSQATRFAAVLIDGEAAARAVSVEATGAGIPMILLMADPSSRPSDGPPLACAARLSKPVRQSELFDALATLDDPARKGIFATAAPDDLPSRPGRPLRILLAEDNPVNQMVALRMLERLGHLATAVDNGRAALDTGLFDLVLMDISMPEMDGFEAVAELRRRESDLPRSRTPVVALTAHAMSGDREHCLSAGFDGYLSKPIRMADLASAITDLVTPTPFVDPAPPTTPLTPFRAELLSASCGGDPEIMVEVLESFVTEAPADLLRLVDALESGDLRTVNRASHCLKGTCLTVGAEALAETCRQFESLPEIPTPTGPIRDRLNREWSELADAIELHRREAIMPDLARS
jgi:two-component system sensor histidine kinase/response regulator